MPAGDELRAEVNGARVSYVVNRNINYTNVCYFHCRFCAFSKGKLAEDLRGAPYEVDLEEIARRTREAWQRGAPRSACKAASTRTTPGRPISTSAGRSKRRRRASTCTPSPRSRSGRARARSGCRCANSSRSSGAGLGSLPGTAAEILDDEVRSVICPDKIDTAQWLEVMRCAHELGLRSTATVMFGHVDHPRHWARHLLRIRALQAETGGFTEFVPLPFVHMEAPIYLKGGARRVRPGARRS